jgi:nitroimidazol reductase NimA-like FMN-containing flavoprotein (pyridoxamine 5'-phosphate oxidase superfamily)
MIMAGEPIEEDPMSDNLTSLARALVDGGRFLTLGTADDDGRPWVSPVWYAPDGDRGLLWVSTPDRRHSRNVAVRSEVSLVIFDTGAAVGAVQAFYATARAGELAGDERGRAIRVFSARSESQGLLPWARADVEGPARHRLYRASVVEAFVLVGGDERVGVDLS